MKPVSILAGVGALLALVGVSSAQPGGPPSAMGAPAAADAPKGYLSAAAAPDGVALLGAPPPEGSGTKAGDVATFRATRGLQGSPRWALAIRDADYGPGPMLHAFSCAAGLALEPATAPATYRLLARVAADAETVGHRAKGEFRRPRPFVEIGGAICVAPEAWLKKSYSYPSGHATYSWAAGLALEEAEPDRATAIMARARAYGESRVVCGVHYPSDIQAGRTLAGALFSALQADPAFQADLAAARAELARLRASGAAAPAAAQCQVEDQAAATPVW